MTFKTPINMQPKISEYFNFEKGQLTPQEQAIQDKLENPWDKERHMMLVQNRQKLLNELAGHEEQLLTTSFNPSTLKAKFDRVNEVSNIINWLNGVERNRFVLPMQFLEQNRLVKPAGGIIKAEA